MQWSVVSGLWLVARMRFSVPGSQFSVHEVSETDGSHSTGAGNGVGDSGSGEFHKLNHQGHEGARRRPVLDFVSFSDYAEHVAYDFRHHGVNYLRNNGREDAAGRHQHWQGNQGPSGCRQVGKIRSHRLASDGGTWLAEKRFLEDGAFWETAAHQILGVSVSAEAKSSRSVTCLTLACLPPVVS
jgi:hypothetical protein